MLLSYFTVIFIVILYTIQSEALSMASSNGVMNPILSSTSRISSILHSEAFTSLSPTSKRAVAAVVGAAVADAATRPFHWLYDRKVLEATLRENSDRNPEFWPTSVSPYYTLPTGRRSCYSDLGYCTLRSLPSPSSSSSSSSTSSSSELTPVFDRDAFITSLVTLFKAPSEYSEALARRKEAYDPAKRLEERKPIEGPWQQGAVTHFLSKIEAGESPDGNPESKETDGLTSTIPLICKLSALGIDPTRSQELRSAAECLSSNPFAFRHTQLAANILYSIITEDKKGFTAGDAKRLYLDGMSIPGYVSDDIDDQILNELDLVEAADVQNEHTTDAIERWGRQCANPGSFMGALLAISKASSPSSSSSSSSSSSGFVDAVRITIKGGGCNCSRANLVGACCGALFGFNLESSTSSTPPSTSTDDASFKGIPIEWIAQTDRGEEILNLAIERVASH